MRVTYAKNTKKNMLAKVVLPCAIVLIIIIYIFFIKDDDVDISNTAYISSHVHNVKKNYVKSDLVKKNRDKYEKDQETDAKKHNQSHLTLASINPIKPTKEPVKTHNIYMHDNSQYNYQKALAEQRKKKLSAQKPKKIKDNTSEIKLSAAFIKELDNINNQKNDNVFDSQTSTFTTISSYDYKDSNINSSSNTGNNIANVDSIMAGTKFYGSISNKVVSDFKDNPVIATVEVGKYKGATFIGKAETANEWVTGVSIRFNKMVFNGDEFAVDAIATNADYQPNLYDDANNHWVERIGGLVIGAGLGAVKGAADQYEGSNQSVIIADGASAPTSQKPDAEQLRIGAYGGAASSVSGQLQPVFTSMWNRPATITVNSGHAIGILFVSTAKLQAKS